MKRNIINICIVVVALFFGISPYKGLAEDGKKGPLVVTISYFSENSWMQYLRITAKSKIDGKFKPVKGAEIKLYLDKDSTGKGLGFIGKVITNEKGKAATNIPPSLAQIWKATPNHTFVAVTDKNKDYDETSTELAVAKARIEIDTTDDKNVVATFSEYKGNNWVPVKGVEIKLGIARLGGDLLIGDEQSYTTDSLGKVKGEFKRMGLPGNDKGNIQLIAKVEDNDQYGNLRIDKTVTWGKKFVPDKNFFHRALWASRFHSPFWLVGLAYTIIISVWGTLIYLVILLVKIKKLGKAEEKLK